MNRLLNLSVVAFFTMTTVSLPAAENLADRLRKTGLDRLLGTWVDAETKGKKLTTTYTWRFKDKVIENTTTIEGRKDVALIGLNARTGEMFQMTADDQGGSSLGSWKGNPDRSATLGVLFTTGDGQQGAISIDFRFENNDTLIMTLPAEKPVVFRLVRSSEDKKGKNKGVDPSQ
ncbi:MAG: hypothetical protein AAF514_18470 [Verrucomicrobiota bacterium]